MITGGQNKEVEEKRKEKKFGCHFMSDKPGFVTRESERGAYPKKGIAMGDAVSDSENKGTVKKKEIKNSFEMKKNLSTETS